MSARGATQVHIEYTKIKHPKKSRTRKAQKSTKLRY
jgi:hypothetical protein